MYRWMNGERLRNVVHQTTTPAAIRVPEGDANVIELRTTITPIRLGAAKLDPLLGQLPPVLERSSCSPLGDDTPGPAAT